MGRLRGTRLPRQGGPGSASWELRDSGEGDITLGTHPRSHQDKAGGGWEDGVLLCGDPAATLCHLLCATLWETSQLGHPGAGRAVAAGCCRLEILMTCCKTTAKAKSFKKWVIIAYL